MGDKPYSQVDDVKDLVEGKPHQTGKTSAQEEPALPPPPPADEDDQA